MMFGMSPPLAPATLFQMGQGRAYHQPMANSGSAYGGVGFGLGGGGMPSQEVAMPRGQAGMFQPGSNGMGGAMGQMGSPFGMGAAGTGQMASPFNMGGAGQMASHPYGPGGGVHGVPRMASPFGVGGSAGMTSSWGQGMPGFNFGLGGMEPSPQQTMLVLVLLIVFTLSRLTFTFQLLPLFHPMDPL